MIIIAFPILGAILTVSWIAAAAFVAGLMAIAVGWRLRSYRETADRTTGWPSAA